MESGRGQRLPSVSRFLRVARPRLHSWEGSSQAFEFVVAAKQELVEEDRLQLLSVAATTKLDVLDEEQPTVVDEAAAAAAAAKRSSSSVITVSGNNIWHLDNGGVA